MIFGLILGVPALVVYFLMYLRTVRYIRNCPSGVGVIDALGLKVLRDDKAYFPPYEAAIAVRAAALAANPGLLEALLELSRHHDVYIASAAMEV